MAFYDQTLAPFDLKTAVVLITGGSSGIGLALCDEFVSRGSRVLITGRREAELQKQQAKHGKDRVPAYYVSNAAIAAERQALFQQVTAEHPDVNVVINNAGIQRRGDQRKEIAEDWAVRQEEIDINLSGPIHLTSLFIPHLISRSRPAAIVNVTSGLAFVPYSAGPVYSATKAGLHQYTLAVRPLLQDTECRLVELIPPAVKSNLGGSHDFGEDPVEFCRHVVNEFESGKLEFGYKFSDDGRLAGREKLAKMHLGLNGQRPVPTFGSK